MKKYSTLVSSALMAFAALLCAPTSATAQSILGTASNYALLGGTAISVGGAGPNVFVNGNVGLWPNVTTAITGFPPATVTGTTLTAGAAAIIATGVAGGLNATAAADLQKAMTGLTNMAVPPANILTGQDLGTLPALPPGVYYWADATAGMTGTLQLDAQGKNNVAWVFQFKFALTTAALAKVKIINPGTNGGSDDGIFWNAATSITFGEGNTVLGNYLAGVSITDSAITSTDATGGARFLALAAISFAGPFGAGNTLNPLGGPGGGDMSGGLTFNGVNVVLDRAPLITTQPATQTVLPGATVSFSVVANGVPATLTYTWKKGATTLTNGGNVSGATSSTLQLTGVAAADAASYTVTVSNGISPNAISTGATLTVNNPVPVITNPPGATGAAAGTVGTAFPTYTVMSTGTGAATYTATGLPPGLTLNSTTGAIDGTPTVGGTYVVTIYATNTGGTSTGSLTITVTSSQIVNFSARAMDGPGSQTLIMGFVTSGDGENLLMRGIGPSLGLFGISNFIAQPMLTLYDGNGAMIASNNGWATNSSGQDQSTLITSTDTQVGAFPLPAGSKDSALLVTVNNGAHTTGLLTPDSTSGVGLIEIYDTGSTPGTRLINVSARMNVTANDGVLIAGLDIAGDIPITVLIRGVGPTLSQFGVTGVLANPQISVYSGGTWVASDAGWGNAPTAGTPVAGVSFRQATAADMSEVGAFALPAGSADSAMVLTLQPGSYTVQVTGVSNTTGVALIEVYDTTL